MKQVPVTNSYQIFLFYFFLQKKAKPFVNKFNNGFTRSSLLVPRKGSTSALAKHHSAKDYKLSELLEKQRRRSDTVH